MNGYIFARVSSPGYRVPGYPGIFVIILLLEYPGNCFGYSSTIYKKIYKFINYNNNHFCIHIFNFYYFKDRIVCLTFCSNELSKENANLITAEGTLIYVFKKLNEMNTPLSQDIIKHLQIVVEQRRQKDLITLLLFLHHGRHPKNTDFLSYSSKTTIKLLAKQLINRLNPDQIQNKISESDSSSSSDDTDRDCEKTAYDELQKSLNSFTSTKFTKFTASSVCANIEKDFKFVELNRGMRSEVLENL